MIFVVALLCSMHGYEVSCQNSVLSPEGRKARVPGKCKKPSVHALSDLNRIHTIPYDFSRQENL